jgi:hypothetical protein
MTKALKPYLGITLATLLLVQAMVLPFLVQNEASIIQDNLPYQIGSFVNHDEKSPIVFESDRIILSVSNSFTQGGDFISVSFADYFLYLHHYLRTAYQLCQEVNLVFGIRELKFPTHFFW